MAYLNRAGSTVVGLILTVLSLAAGEQAGPIAAWTPTGNMTTGRSQALAALMADGRMLFAGGNRFFTAPLSVEIYDPASGQFSVAASLNQPRDGAAIVALLDGRVLVAGGLGSEGVSVDSAEIYDPTLDAWALLGPMTERRAWLSASRLPDGRVLLAGGSDSDLVSQTVEIFDPATGTFTQAGVMSTARSGHAVTALADGSIVIAGGYDGNSSSPVVEAFNPTDGSITVISQLTFARNGFTATALPDGRVLFAGGFDGETARDIFEILDPSTGAVSTLAGSGGMARAGHQAFLLPHNNAVLIVGGYQQSGAPAPPELFLPWQNHFYPTALPPTQRSDPSGGPLATEGLFLLAGGIEAVLEDYIESNQADLYSFATLRTDKIEYAQGDTAQVTGIGWQPGETVLLRFRNETTGSLLPDLPVVADATGRIAITQATSPFAAGAAFSVTGYGLVSEAQAWFRVHFIDAFPVGTIDQAPGQSDPASSAPILFSVMFSEPVTGLGGGSVSFAGSTAGGALAATVTGSGTTYVISVSGMTSSGLVWVSIPAGAVLDAAGQPNQQAVSGPDGSVAYTFVPPLRFMVGVPYTLTLPGGLSVRDEDLVTFDPATGAYEMYFDGSDVLPTSAAINAAAVTADGSLIIAFEGSLSLSGLGSVTPQDLIKFTPVQLGSTTLGTFTMYFDGSDVGLTTVAERIDAVELLPDGSLLISTTGNVSVSAVTGTRYDVLRFFPYSLGSTTSGSWAMHFDGSDVGLTATTENVTSISTDGTALLLSTLGSYSVSGLSGRRDDVLRFQGTFGPSTSGVFSRYFDGGAVGLAAGLQAFERLPF